MSTPDIASERIAGVRHFNRFYTRQIGLLRNGLLGTSLSLTEGRVLYELAQRQTATAAELAADLDIDPGYLSGLEGAAFGRRAWSRAHAPPRTGGRAISP